MNPRPLSPLSKILASEDFSQIFLDNLEKSIQILPSTSVPETMNRSQVVLEPNVPRSFSAQPRTFSAVDAAIHSEKSWKEFARMGAVAAKPPEEEQRRKKVGFSSGVAKFNSSVRSRLGKFLSRKPSADKCSATKSASHEFRQKLSQKLAFKRTQSVPESSAYYHRLFKAADVASSEEADPEWRNKLEQWAGSLEEAIDVVRREEDSRRTLAALADERRLLNSRLQSVSREKDHYKRRCLELESRIYGEPPAMFQKSGKYIKPRGSSLESYSGFRIERSLFMNDELPCNCPEDPIRET